VIIAANGVPLGIASAAVERGSKAKPVVATRTSTRDHRLRGLLVASSRDRRHDREVGARAVRSP